MRLEDAVNSVKQALSFLSNKEKEAEVQEFEAEKSSNCQETENINCFDFLLLLKLCMDSYVNFEDYHYCQTRTCAELFLI